MKTPDYSDKWVAVDLHVHTPASKDYKGSKDDSEYLNIIRRAGGIEKTESESSRGFRKEEASVQCIAFTDHNSVKGFRNWRQRYEECVVAAEFVRQREPNGTLIRQLDEEIDLLQSVRVLMGVEVKANPNVHLLVIFQESFKPELVEKFLSEAYGKPFEQIEGDPHPVIAAWTLQQTLDNIDKTFGENAFVIAPHVENDGGIWAQLDGCGTVRSEAIRHHAVSALSFGRPETRDRLLGALKQPEYKRDKPVALIQSSDYHAQAGSQIGQPRTEILVPKGRATFAAIRSAFSDVKRVRCSIDLTQKQYERMTASELVFGFKCNSDPALLFKQDDYDRVAEAIGALLNSEESGVIELDAVIRSDADRKSYMEQFEAQLETIIGPRIAPEPVLIAKRDLRFSSTRVKIVCKPIQDGRLHLVNGKALLVEDGEIRTAAAHQIESIVAKNIENRFSDRFTDTLEGIASRSVALSKLPSGISLILKCERKLQYESISDLKAQEIEPISLKGRELSELANSAFTQAYEKAAFGARAGNASFVWNSLEPRTDEHYMRFTTFRGDVDPLILRKISSEKIATASLAVLPGGAVTILETGDVVSRITMYVLRPERDFWNKHLRGVAAWFKSSFFIWYCAVHLGEPDLYKHLQDPMEFVPLVREEDKDFWTRLEQLGNNVWIEEKKFLGEIEKLNSSESEYKDKLRRRHNSAINHISATIDREIFDFLKLTRTERVSIAETMKALKMTDFGFLENLEDEDSD